MGFYLMGIIDRYIAREIIISWLTVLFVLVVIVLSTEVVHLLSWITQGFIPVSAFLAYLLNSLFDFIIVLIPLSLLLGILIGFGRLYKDSEMVAIMSAGVGPLQWYRPLMSVVIPVTLLLFVLSLYVKPLIDHHREQITAGVNSRAKVDSLLIGQFNRAGKNGAVLFLESKDRKAGQINNVFFHEFRDNQNHIDIAASSSGYFDKKGQRYMVMHNGVHYAGNPGEANMTIIKYKDYGIHITKKVVMVHNSVSSRSTWAIWHSNALIDKAELQWRLSLPIATLIVSFIALPLSRTNPRSGRYAKLILALFLYLVYSNLIRVSYTWISQGRISPWIGTWWVHLLALGLLVAILKHSGYLYWNKRKNSHGA